MYLFGKTSSPNHEYEVLFHSVISAGPNIKFAMSMPGSEIMIWRRGLGK